MSVGKPARGSYIAPLCLAAHELDGRHFSMTREPRPLAANTPAGSSIPLTRSLGLIVMLFASLELPAVAQNSKEIPDQAAIIRAGQASTRRFEKEASSWTTTTLSPAGFAFVVEVLTTPEVRRTVLSIEIQGRREEVARVIQKDGVWYVKEGRKAGKYRPFEAPLDIPTAYLYLTRSEPQFVTMADTAGFGTYEGTKNGIAIYRNPLPEQLRKQLANTIAQYDQFVEENPGKAIQPDGARSIEAARRLLSDGVTTEVELQSGLLTKFGAPERRTTVSDFRWRGQLGPEEFDTTGTRWDDYTDDPTSGDRNDLLMINHCGVWRPGMKSPETDGRLLDLKTGRFRRIPFQGAMTLPGCFTKDRSRVIVTGVELNAAVMGLYEIDLKTGENRQLGGELLASGFSLFPALSPDGKTVALLHKGASGAILEVQICLVDLATGNAKPLGKPRDTGPLSWLPDGKGVVIIDRKTVDMSKPAEETVCRLDLDGRLTNLCAGSSPRILYETKRILFEEASSRTWKTCDLVGGDIKPYADGMKGCAFPAPSPDEKRLLMMSFRPGRAPVPMIFPLGQSNGTPATTAPGLWASPAWR
jgi:hypothetical protein